MKLVKIQPFCATNWNMYLNIISTFTTTAEQAINLRLSLKNSTAHPAPLSVMEIFSQPNTKATKNLFKHFSMLIPVVKTAITIQKAAPYRGFSAKTPELHPHQFSIYQPQISSHTKKIHAPSRCGLCRAPRHKSLGHCQRHGYFCRAQRTARQLYRSRTQQWL